MDNDAVQRTERPENVVYIGKKPTMTYVLAVITQFNKGMQEVTIKARGNAISTAVNVEQIVLNKFMPNLNNNKKSITTFSEELTNEDGSKSKVSAMQIVLYKP